MEQAKKSGLVTTSNVFGILGIVIALLPLVNPWFLLLSWLAYVLGVIGLILAIIALVKRYKWSVIAFIINVCLIIVPTCLLLMM